MILFVIGVIIGFYLGYATKHEIKQKEDFSVLIECKNEEDMKKVMRQLKGIDKCQKIED